MKAKMLFLLCFSVVMLGFSNTPVFPDNVPEEYVLKFNTDFIKKMDSKILINQIETNFINLFDNVTQIHAQYSEDIGYYYLVFGEKFNSSKIELLKIELEDIYNETYTYIDFSKIDNIEVQEYCYQGFGRTFPPGCPTDTQCVQSFTGFCATIICGVWDGSQCIGT